MLSKVYYQEFVLFGEQTGENFKWKIYVTKYHFVDWNLFGAETESSIKMHNYQLKFPYRENMSKKSNLSEKLSTTKK